MRIATVHRARMTAATTQAVVRLVLPLQANTGNYAVGDWVLVHPDSMMPIRRLERRALLQRRVDGGRAQLIAANVDTLFIVTSCNADFNPARLERYLALANEAGSDPVIVLTKADTVLNASRYQAEAEALQRGVQAAIAAGTLDPGRLDRWRKLSDENRDNTPVLTGPRGNKTVQPRNRRR